MRLTAAHWEPMLFQSRTVAEAVHLSVDELLGGALGVVRVHCEGKVMVVDDALEKGVAVGRVIGDLGVIA